MKNYYFISDLHLGSPDYQSSREREFLLLQWMDMVAPMAEGIFLMGDVFDYWHEYKYVVPKGFVRFLGKLAELSDRGITLYYFTGNHDIWVYDYLPQEIGLKVYREPTIMTIAGKRFYLAHGDGLGPKDYFFKTIKSLFTNRLLQYLYRHIHPDYTIPFAQAWSERSRKKTKSRAPIAIEDEWLVMHSREILKTQHIDYFVYGHRHRLHDVWLNPKSRYLNVGDWIKHYSYLVFDGENLERKFFKAPE